MKNLCGHGKTSALLMILAVALFVSIFSIGGNVKSVNATGTYIHWYNITVSKMEVYDAYDADFATAIGLEVANNYAVPGDLQVGVINSTSVDTFYHVDRSGLVFNVSSLASVNWANVKYATLVFYPANHGPLHLLGMNITLQHSSYDRPLCDQFSGSPEDYNQSWYSGNDGSLNSSDANSFLVYPFYNLNLTSDGLTYIQSVLGGTDMARWIWRSSFDIDGVYPVGGEDAYFVSLYYAIHIDYPSLCIGVEEPIPPTWHYYFDFIYYDQTGITAIPTNEITTHWYNGSQTINYVLGESTLLSGTYTVNLSYKYFDLGNWTFDTATYGNSTVSITLPMLAWSDGYIVVEPNDGHITINSQDDTSLNFTVSGGTPPYNVTIATFPQEPTTVTFNNTDINCVYAIGQETITIYNVSSDGTFYIEKASTHGTNPSNGNGSRGGGGGSWGQAFSNLINEIVKFLRTIPTWAVWLLILLLGLVAIGGMTADKSRGRHVRKSITPVRKGI